MIYFFNHFPIIRHLGYVQFYQDFNWHGIVSVHITFCLFEIICKN